MELSNSDIENIRSVAAKVERKIFSGSGNYNVLELRKFRNNPLEYFVVNGLKDSVRKSFRNNNFFYQEFQSAFRDIARKILQAGIRIVTNTCFQCVIGLLILIMAILTGAGVDFPSIIDLKEVLIKYVGYYFAAQQMAKAIVTKLVEFLKAEGIPHLSPNNIATYLCHLAGHCPTPGIF